MSRTEKVSQYRTTVGYHPNGNTVVTYINTPVVIISPTGDVMLNHGGHITPTTKLRMNQASNEFDLGYTVRQKDYEWWIDYNKMGTQYTIPFDHERVIIRSEGSWESGDNLK
tara:strand:- start:2224 stop:2559 length:336 start_codon:yes stop_codon:yes gene_type:complete